MKYNDSPTKAKSRSEIVDSAMKVFLEKGIGDANIKSIMEGTTLERKTFYTFFSSKEELAEYLFVNVLNEIIIPLEYENIGEFDTGYDKFSFIIHSFIDAMFKVKNLILYTTHYDYYFRVEAESSYISDFVGDDFQNAVYASYKEGVHDGSILSSEDIDNEIGILFQAIFAYVSRMFFRGHIIKVETGIGEESIYEFIEILLRGIKK